MIDGFVKITNALATLISAAAWPVVVGGIVYLMRGTIERFMTNVAEIKLKGAGGEIILTRDQAELVAVLTAATIDPAAVQQISVKETAQKALAVVKDKITAETMARTDTTRLLWVDDMPMNNMYILQAFRSIGITVVTALSTDEALDRLHRDIYDIIISDLGRPGDDMAGRTLLRKVRELGLSIPYIVYASARVLPLRDELVAAGALDCTNDPTTLFSLVVERTVGDAGSA